MIEVPHPLICEPDKMIEMLADKFTVMNSKGEDLSWAMATMSVMKMFLSQGIVCDFRTKHPMMLKVVANHVCVVRYIHRKPSKDEKFEDIFFPFVDDDVLSETWDSVLIFKDNGVHFHIWEMLGWAKKEEVLNWKKHTYKMRAHHKFSRRGRRGEVHNLRSTDSFYNEVIFPEKYPFVWSMQEASAEEQADEEQKAEERDKMAAPGEVDWGL